MSKLLSILSFLILLGCSSSEKADMDSNSYTLKIEFENADGLTSGAELLLRGKKIGEVTGMDITNGGLKIIVEVKIDNNLKIPKGSVFTIYSSDLTGTRAVNVEFSNSKEHYTYEDKIKGENQKSLGEKVDVELKGIKTLLENSIEIIDENDSILLVKIRKDTGVIQYINSLKSNFNKSTIQQINK